MKKDKKIAWSTEKRKVSELKGYENNPRKISESQFEELKQSIIKFNYVEIVAVNTDNTLVAGHMRVKALLDLGRGDEMIEVRVPNRKLNKKEFEEYLIRSNKNTGEWDFEKLASSFSFGDLKSWGFGKEELHFFDSEGVKEDGFDAEAEYAKIKKPQTKLGDIYQLNGHRLICGDSKDEKYFKILFKNKKARLIHTDPPYNVDYKSPSGNSYSKGKYGNDGKIFNDNKKPEEALELYTKTLENLFKFTTDDCVLYWWFADRNVVINLQAFESAAWHKSQTVIWVKERFVFSYGQDYHRCFEPCIVGWKQGKKHFTNKKLANLKDVHSLDFDSFIEVLDLWFINRDNTNDYVHPTQKPVRLSERALRKSSQRGDIVVDAFGGSGSTLIGCEQMERLCYLIELDPKYADVIVKRYVKFCNENKIICKVTKNGKLLNNNAFLKS